MQKLDLVFAAVLISGLCSSAGAWDLYEAVGQQHKAWRGEAKRERDGRMMRCGPLPWQRKDISAVTTPQDVDACLHTLQDLQTWIQGKNRSIEFTAKAQSLKVAPYMAAGTLTDIKLVPMEMFTAEPWELTASINAISQKTGYQFSFLYDSDAFCLEYALKNDKQIFLGNHWAREKRNMADILEFLSDFADAGELILAEERAVKKAALAKLDVDSMSSEAIQTLKTSIAGEAEAGARAQEGLRRLRTFLTAADKVRAKMAIETQKLQAKLEAKTRLDRTQFMRELSAKLGADASDKQLLELIGKRFADGKIASEEKLRQELESALALSRGDQGNTP